MKLVEMYYVLESLDSKSEKDYNNFIKKYKDELIMINENIVFERHTLFSIRNSILEILQDFDIREVLDQAETLFNDILRHEEESKGKLSPNMKILRDEALKIEKEFK